MESMSKLDFHVNDKDLFEFFKLKFKSVTLVKIIHYNIQFLLYFTETKLVHLHRQGNHFDFFK